MARPLSTWRWWNWAGALALVGLTTVPTWSSWADTLRVGWRDEESNHILLVPFVFAWLFLVRRGRLRQCRVTASGRWVGVGIAVLGWVMWRYGYYHGRDIPWHAGPIVLAVGALIACTGKDLLLKFLPAFVVLVFLVHVSSSWRQQVAGPMQTMTAAATQTISSTLGMDVVRQGNVLDVAGTDIAVAEACNGMRMIVTLILASYVFAFVNPLGPWMRALIVLLAPATAIAANVARLVPTVLAYQHLSRDTADMLHDLSGWFMLVASFMVLTALVNVGRWVTQPVDEPRTVPA